MTRLLRVAERIVGCRDLAWDAVQETLLTLWHTGASPPNLRAWLVRTVVHRSLHARRTEDRRRKWEERAAADGATTCPLCDPEREIAGRELRRDLDAALTALTSDQRVVLALRVVEGLDYAAVAKRLGVPIGTVRSRLNRARETLRSEVERSTGPGTRL